MTFPPTPPAHIEPKIVVSVPIFSKPMHFVFGTAWTTSQPSNPNLRRVATSNPSANFLSRISESTGTKTESKRKTGFPISNRFRIKDFVWMITLILNFSISACLISSAVGGGGETFSPCAEIGGRHKRVSAPQLGHATFSPSCRASNSIPVSQCWQRQTTRFGVSSGGLLMAKATLGKIYFRQWDFGLSTDTGLKSKAPSRESSKWPCLAKIEFDKCARPCR